MIATLTDDIVSNLRSAVAERGIARLSRDLNMHHATLYRALRGERVSQGTIAKLGRIAPRVRRAEDFAAVVQAPPIRPPIRSTRAHAWDIESIRRARDAQLRGDFATPVALAEAMRTDDALFTAYHNRIAPQSSLATQLAPASGARGEAARKRAASSVFVSRSVLAGLHGTLANHGVAIGYVEHEIDEAGTQIDMRLTEWPLDLVRWDATREVLTTRTLADPRVDIMHGDGRWIVFRKVRHLPWTQDACVLPGGLVWAAHATGLADWNAVTRAHGMSKIVGELPEGVALNDADGQLTAEARAFLEMLRDMVSGDVAAGLRPPGSKTDFLASGSSAWQVFDTLITGREKAAARIYLGTDATLGSVGGAPGVDIATLFGVATTRLQGDLGAIEEGLSSGLYVPWAAVNLGDSRYAPRFEYLIPDPDEDAKSTEYAARVGRLLDAVERMRAAGMVVEQSDIDALAAALKVPRVPQLAAADRRTSTLQLAPTDIARVVRVNEARGSQGLPPLDDARGQMFLDELAAATKQAEPGA